MAEAPQDSVRAALEELLAWPGISRSPQLARFLSYIVDAKLRGEEGNIKAYSIAVDVFGRPSSFDPQNDPIVRVQARRLRALLNQFHDEGIGRAGVRISLPTGRYIPEFTIVEVANAPIVDEPPTTSEAPARPPPPSGRPPAPPERPRLWSRAAIAAGSVMVVGVVLFLSARFGPPQEGPAPPDEPLVYVGAFDNLSYRRELDDFAAELATNVDTELARFEDVRVEGAEAAPDLASLDDGAYLLSGTFEPTPQGVEVAATLSNGAAAVPIWQATFIAPMAGVEAQQRAAASVAQSIAREIAPFRGPLHARGRLWLDEAERPLVSVNGYICLLTYRLARETGQSIQIVDALACNQRLLERHPNLPLALSADAWLRMTVAVGRARPEDDLAKLLADFEAEAERARQLAPDSSLVNEHLAAVRNWQEQFDAARQSYVAALRANPHNTDARAAYALALYRALDWSDGAVQAERALGDARYPAPWYYYPRAANALREGRLDAAVAAGREAARYGGGETGVLITLAAAALSQREDVVDEFLPRLMNLESLRRDGILPWLGVRIKDAEVRMLVADGLRRAGVPAEALTGPF